MLTWIGVAGKAQTLITGFPGIEDEEKLRLWVINNADNFQPIVAKTENKIDDMIVHHTKHLALNEKAFSAIYNILQLAWNWAPDSAKEPVFGAKGLDCFDQYKDVLDDGEAVENPLLFIAIAGLLIQIVMFIRTQRQ